MIIIKKIVLTAVTLFFATTCISSCKDDQVSVTGVTLDYFELLLPVGNDFTLTATVAPATAANRDVAWESGKPHVASVDAYGKVTARAEGLTSVTVTTAEGGKKAQCMVTVVAGNIAVTGVTLDITDQTLIAVNEECPLTAIVEPAGATDKSVEWKLENVTPAGAVELMTGDNGMATVKAKAEGTAVVTVTTVDGGFTASCEITVEILNAPVPVSATLAGTDELGRVLPGNSEVGDPKTGKQAGIFYFLWMGVHTVAQPYWDLTELFAARPEAFESYNSPHWGSVNNAFYFWGKPVYEYYHSDDAWVALRNIQLLTDAMIDFLVIDATNAYIYENQADVLMRAMEAVRAQGKNPPKIVFYTNTSSGATMQAVYDNFYKAGARYRYPDCWYYLDGKPLVIGVSSQASGKDYESFFTLRESQWPYEAPKANGWPWISFTRPQIVHSNKRGEREIINVSVAQHPDYHAGMGGSAFYGNNNNWGRCYRNGSHGNPAVDIPYGYNFQEQWDYALTQDVPFIFITGWNEWTVQRYASNDGNPEHSYFCDNASPEYSRDAEPCLTAGIKDNYYMQLAANIRRYKGVEPSPDAGQARSIRSMSAWRTVSPEYRDYTGETNLRNHRGAPTGAWYANTTGRNDFHILKVARDEQYVYFYAETVENITPCLGDNWMRLYVDTDRNFQTGWYGYDYRVINGATLQRYENNLWKNVCEVSSQVEKNKLMLAIPRAEIGLSSPAIDMEFKWSDNMQTDDPMDWYLNGDVAPGGRFNYIYTCNH